MPRPYPTHQPLGRIMAEQGWTAAELAAATGIYPRTLTEYLAGRKPFLDHHLSDIALALDVPAADLIAADA